MIKLSIIIPIYNVEKYLKECLDSLIVGVSQKIENQIEVLLINDGSTDNSLSICREYVEKKKYIKLLSKKNGGLSSARNLGISVAKGRYVSFIDSDDIVSIRYVSSILKIINQIDFDIFIFKYQKFIQKNEIKMKKATKSIPKVHKIKKEECINGLTIDEIGSFAWNKVYNRELFKDIKYPEKKYFEDIFTTYRLVNKATKFIASNAVFYYYRQRSGSILHQKDFEIRLKILNDSIKARYELSLFLNKNGSINSQVENNKFLFNDCVHLIKAIFINNKGYKYLDCLKFLKYFNFSIKRDGLKHVLILKLYVINPNILKYLCKLIKRRK